ncbi:MAG: hypothetical protein ACPHOE_09355, partial [Pseudomonadales bacterium]
GSSAPVAGFNLHRVGLQDHIDSRSLINVYGLTPTVAGKTLSLMLKDNHLDLSNLKNLLDGNSATGRSPRMLFLMDEIPAAGASGTMTLSLMLIDGEDGTRSASERKLSSAVKVNWKSDGTNIELTVPSQKQTVMFADGTVSLSTEFDNVAPDVLTLKKDGGFSNYPAVLEVRVLDFFNANTGSIDLAALFDTEGKYFVEVGIDQGTSPNLSYQGAAIDKIQAVVSVKDISAPVVTKFNVSNGDGSDFTSAALSTKNAVQLVRPDSATESTSLELYPLLYGTKLEFDLGPTESLSAATLAGLAEGTQGNALAPSIEFMLDNIPNGIGDFKLTVTFTDGLDATRSGTERQLSASVNASYDADGVTANMTLPGQTQTVTYTTSLLTSDITFSNVNDQMLVVTSAGADYPASLAVRMIAFYDSNAPTNAITDVWSTFFTPGNYHLKVSVDPVSGAASTAVDGLLNYEGMPIRTVEGVIPVE